MNKFEKASKNLMEKINNGKTSVLEYRGENKLTTDQLFERLNNVDLSPENIKKERIENLEKLVKELKSIIEDQKYNDELRIMKLIMIIDTNINNLTFILDNKEQIIEYKRILLNLQRHLCTKINYCNPKTK